MNRKSNILAALMLVVNFFSDLLKELKKRRVTEEMIFDALKSKNDLIPQMAGKIADLILEVGVSIHDFFSANGPVKFYFWDNFRDGILSQKFEHVSGLPESRKHILPRAMNDMEIVKEFKIQPYRSVSELLTAVHDKLVKQPNGEDGELLTNGYANLFYLELNGRVVAVSVHWGSGSREWGCGAGDLDGAGWGGGRCVFSRS